MGSTLLEIGQTIGEEHARELWVSLASLLRSYTAAHGLNGTVQATVELSDEQMLVRCGARWLRLTRRAGEVDCATQDGRKFRLRWNDSGDLLTETGVGLPMDLQAEEWSRELVG